MNKKILDMVQETAQDFYNAGVMKDTTLREIEALCLPVLEEFSAEQIKQIRNQNKARGICGLFKYQ